MQRVETIEELERMLGTDLSAYGPNPHIDHPGVLISMTGHCIAGAVRNGDQKAARIAYSVLMKDPSLPFGKLIKSEFARALKKRADLLNADERDDLVRKTSELLSMEFCPREVEDYCRLVKRFGARAVQAVVDAAHAKNEKSQSLLAYLQTPNLSLDSDASHGSA